MNRYSPRTRRGPVAALALAVVLAAGACSAGPDSSATPAGTAADDRPAAGTQPPPLSEEDRTRAQALAAGPIEVAVPATLLIELVDCDALRRGPREAVVFLEVGAPADQADAVRRVLEADPSVRELRAVSPEESLAEAPSLFPEDPHLTREWRADQLPVSFRMAVADGDAGSIAALDRVRSMPGVRTVVPDPGDGPRCTRRDLARVEALRRERRHRFGDGQLVVFVATAEPGAQERVQRALLDIPTLRSLDAVSAAEATSDARCVLARLPEGRNLADDAMPPFFRVEVAPDADAILDALQRARGHADVEDASLRPSDLELVGRAAATAPGDDLVGGDCPPVGRRVR